MMPMDRPDRRAKLAVSWGFSLVVHLAAVAGALAFFGKAKPPGFRLPAFQTRVGGEHEFECVLLDAPMPKSHATKPVRVKTGAPEFVYDAPPASVLQVPEPPRISPSVAHASGGATDGSATQAAPVAPLPNLGPGGAGSGDSSQRAAASGSRGKLPVPAQARSVVFVIDCSASMGRDGRMEEARAHLIACLRRLPLDCKFHVICYTHRAWRIHDCALISPQPDWIQFVDARMADLVPEGQNDHLAGLREALELRPDAICLLTDADDLTMRQVRDITAVNRRRCSISAVTIGSEPRDAMKLLALGNHGSCLGLTLAE